VFGVIARIQVLVRIDGGSDLLEKGRKSEFPFRLFPSLSLSGLLYTDKFD